MVRDCSQSPEACGSILVLIISRLRVLVRECRDILVRERHGVTTSEMRA